jgi:CheY-like chemotaxis protein
VFFPRDAPVNATPHDILDKKGWRRMGTVLVVEDEKDIRGALQDFLEFEGYDVETAPNGKEALTKMKAKIPALVLLDLMMPVMNGWEFLEEKKRDAELSSTPVLVISAVAGSPYIPGTIGFLKKPIDLHRLTDFVDLYAA